MVTDTALDFLAHSTRPQSPFTDTLAERFYSMLVLDSDTLERALVPFIQAEHELPEPARYEATLARLRAWLELDDEDARVIAGAYERAIAGFPTDYHGRRLEAERAVMMNALTFGEFRRLAGILPWLRSTEWMDALQAAPERLLVA